MNVEDCTLEILAPGPQNSLRWGKRKQSLRSFLPQAFLALVWKSHCTSEHFKDRLAFSSTCLNPLCPKWEGFFPRVLQTSARLVERSVREGDGYHPRDGEAGLSLVPSTFQ